MFSIFSWSKKSNNNNSISNFETRELYNNFYRLFREGSINDIIRFKNYHNLDYHNNNDFGFLVACIHQNTDVINWYIEKIGVVDFHYDKDKLFRTVAKYGTLESLKLLYMIEFFDITKNDNLLLHEVCQYNKIEIAKWLQELCENYLVEINDDKIINYFVFNSSEPTDKELIKKIPLLPTKNMSLIKIDECPICFEDLEIIMPCSHGICFKCFKDYYIKRKNLSKCTLCCQQFEYDQCLYIKKSN